MRIVSGRWGGRRLQVPHGQATRPTAEKVRAAMGNALVAAGALEGARVLDLYAGTGALGLEMVSRGAASAVLVDNGRAAGAAITSNIRSLDARQVTLAAVDVAAFVRNPGGEFDVVLADPPYDVDSDTLSPLMHTLAASGGLAPDADVVVEVAARSGEFPWTSPLAARRVKRYGDTLVCYGRVS